MTKIANQHNDQAEQLKKIFDEVKQNELIKQAKQTETNVVKDDDHELEIDVLNLPPRNQIHRASKYRTRLKVDKSFVRLIFVVIVFLFVIGGTYYIWGKDLITILKNI